VGAIDAAFFDLGRLDRLAAQDTAIHRLDPRAKLLTTLVFLLCVVSFGKYKVSALLPFFAFPLVLALAGRVPLGFVARRVLAVAPFALFVAIFNPLLDRGTLLEVGPFAISGGWVSFTSILLRFALTIGTALVLVATTSFYGLCLGLDRLGTPKAFIVQLLFLYRYLFVLVDEAAKLIRARALRSFGRKGLGFRPYGSLIGQLLLRTLARAQRVHHAMLCRGFDGEVRRLQQLRFGRSEIAFTAAWSSVFLLMRFSDVPLLLGEAALGLAP
jgi:cobalt/nickel transport system permease protein